MTSHTAIDTPNSTDIANTLESAAGRPSETGWARARRLRGRPVVRTCVPAVDDLGGAAVRQPGPDGNIVRGED
ncbi:hypothetical protein [Streptomyces sp. NPDC059378]|uniref:hypothetical protein n=1 Tax=Streptomyces sp. NPDC059378 TaxID=3346815 RepID=UPI00367375EE